MSIISELKRRNVIRVALLYVVASWLILQVADVLFDQLGVPGWAFRLVFSLLLIGFPLVMVFSWVYEITPEGIRKESQVAADQSISHVTGQRLNKAIVALLVIAILAVIADRLIPESRQAAPAPVTTAMPVTQAEPAPQPAEEPAPADRSIAVLPFVNMSGDEENEYFSDGLTEELLNSLARIKDLKVTGRTSSFAFKGQNEDLREIGQALNVAHILEGSVRKANNRVRITAQLIKADDGYHLWSDTFDRELDDIFAIQEEIAGKVARELSATLLGDGAAELVHVGTQNPQAYEHYLRGRYMMETGTNDRANMDAVDAQLQEAIALDPDFTLAWYGKFVVLAQRHAAGQVPYREGAVQMRELADKLLAMDPELPESHVASGQAALRAMNWPVAEAGYREAIRLSPGNITALTGLAGLLMVIDRTDEAKAYVMQALERDPLNLNALAGAVTWNSFTGHCDEATRIGDKILVMAPGRGRVRWYLAMCQLLQENDAQQARVLASDEPTDYLRYTMLAIVDRKLGDEAAAKSALEEMQSKYGENASFQYSQIYAQWGELDKAMDALERAHTIGDSGFVYVKNDQLLEPLHGLPRYQALLEIWADPERR